MPLYYLEPLSTKQEPGVLLLMTEVPRHRPNGSLRWPLGTVRLEGRSLEAARLGSVSSPARSPPAAWHNQTGTLVSTADTGPDQMFRGKFSHPFSHQAVTVPGLGGGGGASGCLATAGKQLLFFMTSARKICLKNVPPHTHTHKKRGGGPIWAKTHKLLLPLNGWERGREHPPSLFTDSSSFSRKNPGQTFPPALPLGRIFWNGQLSLGPVSSCSMDTSLSGLGKWNAV